MDNTSCKSVYTNLTGYVDDNLIKLSEKYKKNYEERSIDVGYRARPLPIYLECGAQEKTDIADKFIRYTKSQSQRRTFKQLKNRDYMVRIGIDSLESK